MRLSRGRSTPIRRAINLYPFFLALTLLMTWVFANYENLAMASNDFALVAHFLDRRTYLHIIFLSVMRTLNLLLHPAAGGIAKRIRPVSERTYPPTGSSMLSTMLFETIGNTTSIEIIYRQFDRNFISR